LQNYTLCDDCQISQSNAASHCHCLFLSIELFFRANDEQFIKFNAKALFFQMNDCYIHQLLRKAEHGHALILAQRRYQLKRATPLSLLVFFISAKYGKDKDIYLIISCAQCSNNKLILNISPMMLMERVHDLSSVQLCVHSYSA